MAKVPHDNKQQSVFAYSYSEDAGGGDGRAEGEEPIPIPYLDDLSRGQRIAEGQYLTLHKNRDGRGVFAVGAPGTVYDMDPAYVQAKQALMLHKDANSGGIKTLDGRYKQVVDSLRNSEADYEKQLRLFVLRAERQWMKVHELAAVCAAKREFLTYMKSQIGGTIAAKKQVEEEKRMLMMATLRLAEARDSVKANRMKAMRSVFAPQAAVNGAAPVAAAAAAAAGAGAHVNGFGSVPVSGAPSVFGGAPVPTAGGTLAPSAGGGMLTRPTDKPIDPEDEAVDELEPYGGVLKKQPKKKPPPKKARSASAARAMETD